SSLLCHQAADEPGNIDPWCTLQTNSNNDFAAGVRGMTTTQIEDVQAINQTNTQCGGQQIAIDVNKISVFIPIVNRVQTPTMTTGHNSLGNYATWRTSGKEVWEYQSCSSWDCGGQSATG